MLVGTGMGGLTVFSDGVQALIEKGYRKITPFFIPYAITNMGSALLAIDLGFMGPNYSISTACATSNYCFYAAANHIRRGEADLMLAGGTEAAILPIGLGGFVACRALSQRNDDPKTASRPWDKDRDGFVMGEGAGVLVRWISIYIYMQSGSIVYYLSSHFSVYQFPLSRFYFRFFFYKKKMDTVTLQMLSLVCIPHKTYLNLETVRQSNPC